MPPNALPIAPSPASAAVRAVMRGNRGRDTRPELALRAALHRMGLRYRIDRAPERGLRCRADVVFPRERVAVFVDGCYWHACEVHGRVPSRNSDYWAAKLALNKARDARNNERLEAAGWQVIRAWEHEVPAEVAETVAAAVRGRRLSANASQLETKAGRTADAR